MALPETDFDARARALTERALAPPVPFPKSWLPLDQEVGHPNPLIGFMQLEDVGETVHGPSTIMVLRDGEGIDWSVWIFPKSAFLNEYNRKRPQPGELVCVLYEGKRRVKNPQPGRRDDFHSFVLTVERDGSAPAVAAEQSQRLAEVSREQEVAVTAIEEPEAVVPADKKPKFCRDCGMREPEHAEGCTSDIPF